MKKTLLLIYVCVASLSCMAQSGSIDKELASLVEVVKMLRVQNEANFNKAVELLKADYKWTAMSETGEIRKTECKPIEKVPGFKLNRILTSAMKGRKYVSTKDEMLNGEDPRYNYSLYERSLKGKCKATYNLKKRQGKQTLVVVPFNGQKGSLSMKMNGKAQATTQEGEDGTLVCSFIASDKELSFTITNLSKNPLAFVILNHNSRKK